MIVIVGGGYAGGATAWALARRGHGPRVTLLEAEATAGRHASGRNAGLIAPLLEDDPVMLETAVKGARMLRASLGYEGCGSALLVTQDGEADGLLANARLHGLRAARMATADLADRIPLLAGAATPIAVACRDDGRIDPCGLAKRYLAASREGGVTIMMGARATGLRTRGETVTGVETSAGFLPAEWVVNAAGAWAGSVGSTLGEGLLDDLGLTTHRRHLFRSTRVTGLDPRWPFVWDLSHDVYFLTDASYLTLSACDEEPHPAVEPAICARAGVELDRKLSRAMPAVARIARAPLHACLRTFSTDRRFVVGPDPRLSGFFWVAGLGGSGATAGAAAGDLAAGLLLGDRSVDETARRAFDPARLVGRR